MYAKMKNQNKTIQKQEDSVNQESKNSVAVKFINWSIAVNGNSTNK